MTSEDLTQRIWNCDRCPCYRGLPYGTLPLAGRGLSTAKYVFAYEHPSLLETSIGEAASESYPAGDYFWRVIQEDGFIKEDVYVTPLIKCCVPKAKKSYFDICIDWFWEELTLILPEKVFLMGSNVSKIVLKHPRYADFSNCRFIPCVSMHVLYNGGQKIRVGFSKVIRGKQK